MTATILYIYIAIKFYKCQYVDVGEAGEIIQRAVYGTVNGHVGILTVTVGCRHYQ